MQEAPNVFCHYTPLRLERYIKSSSVRLKKRKKKLDLVSGYHQVKIAAEDVEKTMFNSRYGHYEWMVMSFGMTNAPQPFKA